MLDLNLARAAKRSFCTKLGENWGRGVSGNIPRNVSEFMLTVSGLGTCTTEARTVSALKGLTVQRGR